MSTTHAATMDSTIRALARIGMMMVLFAASAMSASAHLANVSPTQVDFGDIKVGASVSVNVSISNLSAVAVSLTGGGFDTAGAFGSSMGSCSSTIAAGATCYLQYTFTPKATDQDFSAGTSIALYAAGEYDTIALSFAGRGVESLTSVSPVSIDFGDSLLGATVMVPMTVLNTSPQPLHFAGGGIGAPFGGYSGTCGGSTLAVGASCQFDYTYTPSTTMTQTGSTSLEDYITSPSVGEYVPIALSGNGATSAGFITFYPRSIDFGRVKIGRTVKFDFLATNIGANTVTFAGGGLSDTQGGAFNAVGDCGGGLAPGAQCYFEYRFQPRALGALSASTSVSAYAGGQSQVFAVQVSGTGVGTLAQVSPTSIDFGPVQIGTSMTVPVTVVNTSEAPLTGFLGGGANTPFVSSNNCPASLAVGASCQFTYRFQPAASQLGVRSETTILSFTNSTGVRPNVVVTLTGTGYDVDRIFNDGFD